MDVIKIVSPLGSNMRIIRQNYLRAEKGTSLKGASEIPKLSNSTPLLQRKIYIVQYLSSVILGLNLISGCVQESPAQMAARKHEDGIARSGGSVELKIAIDSSGQSVWCTLNNGTDRDAVFIRHDLSLRAFLHTSEGLMPINKAPEDSESSSPDIRNVVALPPDSRFSFFIPIHANHRLRSGDKISVKYSSVGVSGILKKVFDEWPDAIYDSSLESSVLVVK